MFNRSLRLATQQSRATALHFRTLSTTPRTLFPSSEKPNSEGHATRKADDPIEGGLDVQNAAVRSAQDQAKHGRPDQGGPHDTAAEDKGGVANTTGEKEKAAARAKSDNELAQIGSFKDHRGGISENDKPSGSVGGKEEANAPSITARVKQATGIGASKKDHQESKTGPTTNRGFHTSAWAMEGKKDASKAGLDLHADGEGPRTPVDEGVAGEQNPHLKHKKAGEPDSGKGNAAPTPHLPSHSRAAAQKNTDKESQQKARYHTSARRLAGNPPGGYAAATNPEPAKSGYNVPGQAFPNAELHARPPPPQPGLKPASQLPHSSTGEEPPHPHVNAPVGSKKNPPPGAEAGKAGLDEGYKTRNP